MTSQCRFASLHIDIMVEACSQFQNMSARRAPRRKRWSLVLPSQNPGVKLNKMDQQTHPKRLDPILQGDRGISHLGFQFSLIWGSKQCTSDGQDEGSSCFIGLVRCAIQGIRKETTRALARSCHERKGLQDAIVSKPKNRLNIIYIYIYYYIFVWYNKS